MAAYLTGGAILILDSILMFLAICMVTLRGWFRLSYLRQSLNVSELFLLLATILVLSMLGCFARELQLGLLDRQYATNSEELKLLLSTVFLYDSALYTTKFSILAFYFYVFPSSSRKLRYALYAITAYTVACYLAAFFVTLFWCGSDVSVNWSLDGKCTFWSKHLVRIDWSMNISSDLLVFGLPFPIIINLKLELRQIIALLVTFGLALITLAVSIARFISFQQGAFNTLYVCSMAETCTAIIVVSLPALGPLLKRIGRTVTEIPTPRSQPTPSSWDQHSMRKSMAIGSWAHHWRQEETLASDSRPASELAHFKTPSYAELEEIDVYIRPPTNMSWLHLEQDEDDYVNAWMPDEPHPGDIRWSTGTKARNAYV